jgi:hypothetical protein
VRLLEFERVEVGGDCIVGGVFEVCWWMLAGCTWELSSLREMRLESFSKYMFREIDRTR